MSYSDLSDQEPTEIVATLKSGKPLPSRYKASLFEDNLNAELIWPGKTTEIERSVLPFQSIGKLMNLALQRFSSLTSFQWMEILEDNLVGGLTNSSGGITS